MRNHKITQKELVEKMILFSLKHKIDFLKVFVDPLHFEKATEIFKKHETLSFTDAAFVVITREKN